MTSEAFVWVYLPGHTEPVVCGRLFAREDGGYSFIYGRSYRDREESIPLAPDTMPLGGTPSPLVGRVHCRVRSAMPDRMLGDATSPSTAVAVHTSMSSICS